MDFSLLIKGDDGLKKKKLKFDHEGTRTPNLPIRSRTPYPLGHAADIFESLLI